MTIIADDGIIERGETLVGLGALARKYGFDPATFYRQATKGTRTPSGDVIRLASVWIGSRMYSSHEAVIRYSREIAAARSPGGQANTAVPPRSPHARSKASESAARQLEAMGI